MRIRFLLLCRADASSSLCFLPRRPQAAPKPKFMTVKKTTHCPAVPTYIPEWIHRNDLCSFLCSQRRPRDPSARSCFDSTSSKYQTTRLAWLQNIVATALGVASATCQCPGAARAAVPTEESTPSSSPSSSITMPHPLPSSIQVDCPPGCLATERAIPGAYESPCMMLSTRSIPIQTTNPSTAVEVLLEQDEQSLGPGSTGSVVWNSSILLQRLLEQLVQTTPNFVRNKVVLELGCGVGLGSLTCAVLGARQVIATDSNIQVLKLARRNVLRNEMQDTVSVEPLLWGALDAIDKADMADLIIGADLTYNPGSWRALAETMATVLAPAGFILYLSLGHAGFDVNGELDGFLAVAREQGLINVPPHDPEWPFQSISMSLSDLTRKFCVRSLAEQAILDGTGGVRAVLLKRKRSRV